MGNFIVSTDSGCDLSREFCEEKDIRILFMSVEINGKLYKDTMRVPDIKKYYEGMANGDAPHTGAVNISDYLEHWGTLVNENKPIIHITLGSGISGTYMNACLALEEFKNDHPKAEIYVVDSTLASTSYGMLAIKAAEMRDEGKTAEECVKVLDDLKPKINAYYTTDDLTYLYRGGRVSKTGKILAHALGICPILNLDDKGCLKAFEKCRGKKNTFQRIKEIIKELVINPEEQILYICHSDIEEFAENYGAEVTRELGFKGYKTFYIGTTIGAHTGPGLIALFFVGKERTPAK